MKNPLRILLVDDEEIVLRVLEGYFSSAGHQIFKVLYGEEALSKIEESDFDLIMLDIHLPDMDGINLLKDIKQRYPELPVVIITGQGTLETAIQALRLGAADYLEKPVKLLELDAILEKIQQLRKLNQEKTLLSQTLVAVQQASNSGPSTPQLIGQSSSLRKVQKQIRQAVQARCSSILITGETGTGKEVVAKVLHDQAGGDRIPFIAVSCPALSETLVESELFGHVKGAFTGAIMNHYGYFRMADKGTLFLDEIADLSLSMQAKLLRVLETRSFRPIGSHEEIRVDLRLIAASNILLENLLKEGRFRQDLFFRLNAFHIHLSPLRERKEDIIPLAEHFLNSFLFSKKMGNKFLSTGARQALLNYSFPGNVRELRNIVERAAIISSTLEIGVEHLYLSQHIHSELSDNTSQGNEISASNEEAEKISSALKEAKWNRKNAARILHMPYSTLRYKINQYGL
ncbi:MAG: sigma-54-dependent Fis family transcriptional regulator [Candidatus Aureabacteria bacterium]|nr:sigma-54-dependent Fis family transcriptional regulator [Candidatus Auribacterota bacterium]